ncbi:unnamed protein product [Closterium sp. NIES-54]
MGALARWAVGRAGQQSALARWTAGRAGMLGSRARRHCGQQGARAERAGRQGGAAAGRARVGRAALRQGSKAFSSMAAGHARAGHSTNVVPRWADLLKKNIDIFALDFDAILGAMYALTISVEGDCYLRVPPDPGIGTSETVTLGASASAALGPGEAAALGASESAAPGACASALASTASTEALHTFTLDSGASRCFFRDRTVLEQLARPVAVSLADPSGGPVLATSSTVLPCPAVPAGTLSGLYLPSFSTNLVAGSALQDGGVHQFTPAYERVTHGTCARTGRHLATFTRQPGSDLYTLTTESPQVAASASASGQLSPPCSCRTLSHQTVLWHHCLGHPSVQRLHGMHSRYLVSGLPRVLPPLPPSPAPPCLPCVEGRQRATPHSSSFPPTEAPQQTLHLDVWGPARVRGQGHERYFKLVVDDYMRYTTVFPLRTKGEVPDVLIPWIRAARLQLRKRFQSDFLVLRLHSDRGGEFSSDLLAAYCVEHSIRQTFTLTASPQQNGVAECRIRLVMEVALTSMIHAAAPHFLWPFAVQYAAHQLNLWPRVSAPETSPTLCWTGEVGDASVFWGPAPSGVSQVDPVKLVEVAVDSGLENEGAETGGAETGGAEPGGAETGGAKPGGAETDRAAPSGTPSSQQLREWYSQSCSLWRGAAGAGGSAGVGVGGAAGAVSRPEPPSPQRLREWYARRCSLRSGAHSTGVSPTQGPGAARGAGASGPGGARTGGTGAAKTGGSARAGAGVAGASATGGTAGVGGAGGTAGAGAGGAGAPGAAGGAEDAGPTGVGVAPDPGVGVAGAGAGGADARPPAGAGVDGAAGAGATGGTGVGTNGAAGGATGVGAATRGSGAVSAGSGGASRPRPYFVPLLQQVLGGLTERREPGSRPVSPESRYASPVRAARTGRRVPRQRPLAVPGTYQMTLRPSTAPQRVPLPSLASSLPALADPESDSLRAASPTVTRLLATAVTDPSFESVAASALVAELVNFEAHCRLDYAASLVAESESVCPLSVGGECALGTDVLEDRQEDFEFFAAAVPHLVSMLITPEGDPDAPDIPTSRSYAEAIAGEYSSQWQSAMDAKMAYWKSTGTYVDDVPPPGANIGVDFFQTFSPTPKMTTLWMPLHVAAQSDYELHSLHFSTAFLQGSLHEEIWLRRPPDFTGSFPPGTQWSRRRPVYGLRQAPREWYDTLRTTLAALGFAPSTADPSLGGRAATAATAARGPAAAGAAGGSGATGPGGAHTGGTGAAGPDGAAGAEAARGAGAGGATGAGAVRGTGAGAAGASGGPTRAGAAGGAGARGAAGAGAPVGAGVGASGAAGGAAGAGGTAGVGAATRGAGSDPAGSGGAARPRPTTFRSFSRFLPASPLPAPSPYTGPTGGPAGRREPASHPASPVHAASISRRGSRQRPPPVSGTHRMALRPSTAPQHVPLPSPPASSLPAPSHPESDSLRDASPTVPRLLATVVTDPSFESTAASALVAELVDFAAHYHLDYAASLVAESASVCPPSVGGECALGTDVLEDRQEDFECFAAAVPHLVSMLIATKGDPDAPDIPTPRSYADAIEGP